jgi:hypothetical protein
MRYYSINTILNIPNTTNITNIPNISNISNNNNFKTSQIFYRNDLTKKVCSQENVSVSWMTGCLLKNNENIMQLKCEQKKKMKKKQTIKKTKKQKQKQKQK